MKLNKKKVFLVDTNIYIYKSFYVINYNKSVINFKESFIVFWNMLFSKYNIYKPKYIIFIFDNNKKNFRNEIYKKYKTNRKNISLFILEYIIIIKNNFKLWGIKYITIPNVEGDDIICSLIYNFFNDKKKYIVYILSYDKDLLQLVNNNVFLLVDKKNIFNKKNIFKKYGIKNPNLIKDFLVLCGDKCDNIPGIKGIGKKTASILLNRIGNVFSIYNNLNKIKNINIRNNNLIFKNLHKNYKNILIWYKLISLKKNLNIILKLKEFYIYSFFFKKIYFKIFNLNINNKYLFLNSNNN